MHKIAEIVSLANEFDSKTNTNSLNEKVKRAQKLAFLAAQKARELHEKLLTMM